MLSKKNLLFVILSFFIFYIISHNLLTKFFPDFYETRVIISMNNQFEEQYDQNLRPIIKKELLFKLDKISTSDNANFKSVNFWKVSDNITLYEYISPFNLENFQALYPFYIFSNKKSHIHFSLYNNIKEDHENNKENFFKSLKELNLFIQKRCKKIKEGFIVRIKKNVVKKVFTKDLQMLHDNLICQNLIVQYKTFSEDVKIQKYNFFIIIILAYILFFLTFYFFYMLFNEIKK
jgi:hypothetical protein